MSQAMPETHRAAVARNSNQGEYRRVLCVCSGGILRSPTLAWLLSNPPYNCNTRAAGSEPHALIPVDQELLNWAEIVVFLNPENRNRVVRAFRVGDNSITLDIPDRFKYRDRELIRLLNAEMGRAYPSFSRLPQGLTW